MSTRRSVIKNMVAGTAGLGLMGAGCSANGQQQKSNVLKGNINHSVCRWTYSNISLEQLCQEVKSIGFNAIDLLTPKEWPEIQKHGITCSMCYHGGKISLTEGWIHKEHHAWLIKDFDEGIPLVAKAGYKNLICFSGNRNGMDEETGLKNMTEGIKKILPLAEKHNVVLQIEVFNSKVDHKDYMADNTPWTVELCKRIGSENFKILYDIYHMQVNEGDIIRTIRDHHHYFGHYHTAGVPGRHEIDTTQELYYPAIMEAIVKTGYKGYVAQEFIPVAENKLASLREAIMLCDV